VQILLTSVQTLLSRVTSQAHPHLHDLFKSHTFVGFIDPSYSLVQFRTKLYLLNVSRLSKAFFYESVLRQFGHHPILRFGKPIPIRRMIRMAMEHPSQQQAAQKSLQPEQKEALATELTNLLVSRAAMLKEYFALEISVPDDDGEGGGGGDSSTASLLGIPELIDQYNPPLLMLPLFLLKLARDSNWTSEQECFETIAKCIAEFYYVQKSHLYLDTPATAAAGAGASAAAAASTSASSPLPPLSWWVPHVLFPAFRHRSSFSPPASAATDGTVTQVASLENLYKIFERC
jgi:DNA mismatch repair protein MLH1